MATYIQHRERINREEYYLEYEYNNERGAGYLFPCFPDGTLVLPMQAHAWESYQAVTEGDLKDKLHLKGVAKFDTSYYEPAIIKCVDCDEPVVLDSRYESECENCHREYNCCGQALNPRSMWEEPYYAEDYY